jgi:hypothetical protein
VTSTERTMNVSSTTLSATGTPTRDRTLPSGHSDRFVIVMRCHPSGCNDSGTLTIDGWPVVHLGALGLSHDRPASATFAFPASAGRPGVPRLRSVRVPKGRQFGVTGDPLSLTHWMLRVNCLDLGTPQRPPRGPSYAKAAHGQPVEALSRRCGPTGWATRSGCRGRG